MMTSISQPPLILQPKNKASFQEKHELSKDQQATDDSSAAIGDR